MNMATYPIRLREWARPATRICPECVGKKYVTIEVRESVTICAPEYPVTYPVVAYKTRPCWRCHGTGLIEEGWR